MLKYNIVHTVNTILVCQNCKITEIDSGPKTKKLPLNSMVKRAKDAKWKTKSTGYYDASGKKVKYQAGARYQYGSAICPECVVDMGRIERQKIVDSEF